MDADLRQPRSSEPAPLRKRRWQEAGLTLLLLTLGVAQALAMAWPFEGVFQGQAMGLLQLISLTGFAYLLQCCKHAQQAFWRGWWFATGWLVAGTWWLYISMHDYGGMPASLAALAVFLLGAGLALIYALASWAYHRACNGSNSNSNDKSYDKSNGIDNGRRNWADACESTSEKSVSISQSACAFAAIWLLAELIRGNLWTGFPWAAAGYAHVDSALRAWAPWVGVYGLSAISAWASMLAAALLQRLHRRDVRTRTANRYNTANRDLRSGNDRDHHQFLDRDSNNNNNSAWLSVLCACILTLTWVASPLRHVGMQNQSKQPGLSVTLLQGNVPQDLKFGAGVSMALSDYRQALIDNTSDLIVTPETALPLLLDYLPEGYWQRLHKRYATGRQAALIGLPMKATALTEDAGASVSANANANANATTAPSPQYTNSVLALLPGETTPSYRYDKHHLVPFGEFVPPMFRWFVQLMQIPLGDFSRGAVAQPALLWHGERIAPNICFEDLFGEELAQSFANPASAPTLLLNLSNIAWFGNTVAIDQHLHISRMRTLELGRPMLRATNTGATAIINAQGVVTHRLPSGVKGALTAQVRGVDGPATPYARWVSTWGLWPLAVWALAVLVVVAWCTHCRRR